MIEAHGRQHAAGTKGEQAAAGTAATAIVTPLLLPTSPSLCSMASAAAAAPLQTNSARFTVRNVSPTRMVRLFMSRHAPAGAQGAGSQAAALPIDAQRCVCTTLPSVPHP